MGIIIRNCPHCHSQKATFTLNSCFADPNPAKPQEYILFFYCGYCHDGYSIRAKSKDGKMPGDVQGNIEQAMSMVFLKEYPKPLLSEAPKFLPENIHSYYLQAVSSLKTGNMDASAMMSRKVLEVAAKSLNPNGRGSLYNRIEQLQQKGMVSDEIKDWAKEICLDEFETAQEESPAGEDFSNELLSFVEVFLMHTFTLPGMIECRRTAIVPV